MQNVFCSIRNCGFNSNSGFCLNRLVSINEQGVCNYLTKEGWDQEVDKKFKSNYNPWAEQVQEKEEKEEKKVTLSELLETRAPVESSEGTGQDENRGQDKAQSE